MRVETSLSKGGTKTKTLREKEKIMHLSNTRVKNSFVNIIQKRAMKKKTVGNYMLEKKNQFKKNKGKKKIAATTTTRQDLGDDSGDETKITAMGLKSMKGKETETKPITSTSNYQVQAPNEEEIIELFHVRVVSKHTKIDTLFDSGSQANLISEY
jgi:hypothetical protein